MTILIIYFYDICPGFVSLLIFLSILISLFLGQFKSYLCFKILRNLFPLDTTIGFIIFPIYLVIIWTIRNCLDYFFRNCLDFSFSPCVCFIFLIRLKILMNCFMLGALKCYAFGRLLLFSLNAWELSASSNLNFPHIFVERLYKSNPGIQKIPWPAQSVGFSYSLFNKNIP